MSIQSKLYRVMIIIFIIQLVISGLKFYAWQVTGSNAIMTDAMESLANIAGGAMALYSLWLARKPADKEHPYGHGKIEFVSSGFEGSLILLSGVYIVIKSIYTLIIGGDNPHSLQLGAALVLVAGAVNAILGLVLKAQYRKTGSPTIQASATHLYSDALSSVALLLSLVVIYFTHIYWLDSVIAICFGLWIIYQSIHILRGSLSGVMDESSTELMNMFVSNLQQKRKDDWIDMHNARIIRYGTTLHIDAHVSIPWYYTINKGHAVVEQIREAAHNMSNQEIEFFIHTDPCEPAMQCKICLLQTCPVRQAAFITEIPWIAENIVENAKHRLPT